MTSTIRELILSQPDLGKVRDVEIADRLGCSFGTVKAARLSAGIEKAPGMPYRTKLQAAKNDPELATLPSSVLAERYGCKPSSIAALRNQLGIPSPKARTKRRVDGLPLPGTKSRAVYDDPELATASTKTLAARHGVSRQLAAWIRKDVAERLAAKAGEA